MGIAISNWRLAQTVARMGHLGVVSGTAIDTVLVRVLQNGDPGGHLRRAMAHFPFPEMVERALKKYFRENRDPHTPYLNPPMPNARPSVEFQELLMISNFAEVFLAKEGHNGPIGINFLEKIQLPILPSLYGAMLAGAEYVLMGAGIPRDVPTAIEALSRHEDAEYRFHVRGAAPEDDYRLKFSPRQFIGEARPAISRPKFLGIISSTTLGILLAKKISVPVDGFIIEAPSAGGHNAPPRGKTQFNERGEPLYGARDAVDFAAIAELGLPFWLAGSCGNPRALSHALSLGANGVQVGSAFALCDDSGLDATIRDQLLHKIANKTLDVFTDPIGSPTGFPFKVARVDGTNSEKVSYEDRVRRCDMGYLREPYKKPDGSGVGYRCPSEPIKPFLAKGGAIEETVGRKCLCNGLMANIGLAQWQPEKVYERPIITLGDDVVNVSVFFKGDRLNYSARDVIEYLLEAVEQPVAQPQASALTSDLAVSID